MAIPEGPIWFDSKVQYRRMISHHPRAVLEYTVDGDRRPRIAVARGGRRLLRQFEIEPGATV